MITLVAAGFGPPGLLKPIYWLSSPMELLVLRWALAGRSQFARNGHPSVVHEILIWNDATAMASSFELLQLNCLIFALQNREEGEDLQKSDKTNRPPLALSGGVLNKLLVRED